jgi:hypothetical protein
MNASLATAPADGGCALACGTTQRAAIAMIADPTNSSRFIITPSSIAGQGAAV